MKKQQRRSAVTNLAAKRAATSKAEQTLQARAVGRTRIARRKPGMMRARTILQSFFRQVQAGSVRAISVLGVAVLLVVVLPITLLLTGGGDKPAATATPPADEPSERMMLDMQTYSAGTQPETATPTEPTPTPDPHPDNGDQLKRGMNAPVVLDIQSKLMELGYMDWDEPTDFFGPNTKEAVELFQRQHGLAEDGAIGAETYAVLMSEQAQKYMIMVGNTGTDVEELQKRLRELGYIEKATGKFGTETEAAVKKFQEHNGLSPDGMMGEGTRELLYSEDAKANFFERGEVSETIRKYQQKLKELGYLTTDADGTYGRDTENAVKRFQERHALIADGYIGPSTIGLLMSKDAQPNAIVIGMKGSDIEKIQNRLIELKYLSGKADGSFGSKTEQAVRNFQNQHKLSVDGKVGKKTLNKLMSDSAEKSDGSSAKASSGSSSSGSSSGGSSSSGSSSSRAHITGANVESFIAVAESKIGSKYVSGGKGPNTFDCSGFVYWCLNQVGVRQGYMTSASWQKTDNYTRISDFNSLERGDVISFKGHVGIYLGGGKMIDASSSQGKIRIASSIQSSDYWKRTYVCGYRIF